MAFCIKCGHKNPDDGRFCEECGNPLGANKPVPIPTIAAPEASGPQRLNAGIDRKTLVFIGVGIVILMGLGIGLFFMFAPESASSESFAKAIERSLAADPKLYRQHYCLDNFAYDKDPVYVNSYDTQTQRWLSVLTKAGLYSEPESVTSGNGFFVRTQLLYRKTDAGKKAIQGNQLCIADGITVSKVEGFTPPQKHGEFEMSRASVKFAYRNPLPWAQSDEARAVIPRLGTDFIESVLMALKDGKWEIASREAVESANRTERKGHSSSGHDSAAVTAEKSGGFLDAILNVFSFASSNPILGKWATKMMGVTVASFEFRPDSMKSDGRSVKVRYQIEGKRVIVYAEGESEGMIIKVIDKDTIALDVGSMEVQLVRTE